MPVQGIQLGKPWVVFVVAESILHQGAGPGQYNVTSVTIRATLLRCALRKGRYNLWIIWRLIHWQVLRKSSLDWDCTLSSLKEMVDQGFKFSYCWRASQSVWRLTRDQRCPLSLRWSIRSGLGISNCSQGSSTWKPVLVSHYPSWGKFELLWSIRPRKCNHLWWSLEEKSLCCLGGTGLRNWTWIDPPSSRYLMCLLWRMSLLSMKPYLRRGVDTSDCM